MKKIKFIASIIILSLSGYAVFSIHDYLSPALPQENYPIPLSTSPNLTIALIGDSWSNMHAPHDKQLAGLIGNRLPETSDTVNILSSGKGGAKSKNIYYNLFQNCYTLNPKKYQKCAQSIIEQAPKYCIVSAGINDAVTKVGAAFYARNMMLIIRFLLENKIKPIIIEIPSFDIHGTYDRHPLPTKALRRLSMALTSSKLDCIDDYRHALKDSLANGNTYKQILYITDRDWCPNGYKDSLKYYLADGVHPNGKGFFALDSCLAEIISDDFLKETNTEEKP